MRSAARATLFAITGAIAATVLAIGHAAAGGPTSVLIVNPTTGEAEALYNTDPDYGLLQSALEPPRSVSVEQPAELSAGPGSPAINVTWLAHDVSVWRVDHIRLDLKYVWVQTNVMADGALPYDADGSWHIASDAKAVLGVLDRLGVLPAGMFAGGWSAGEAPKSTYVPGDAGEPPVSVADQQAAPQADQAADPTEPSTPSWPWLAAAAAGGLALGAGARPIVAALLRRRVPGPRQEFVDVEPPGDGPRDSGQLDPHPAEATPLVLDLGDLYPADLPR